MKIKLIFLISLLFYLVGCKDSDSESSTLNLSSSSFTNVSADGEVLSVNINSNSAWTINSSNQWCVPDKGNGQNNGEITLTVKANNEQKERTATITVTTEQASKTIKVTQRAVTLTSSEIESYHFQIPVIFHVLYKNQNNTTQYVREGRIKEIMEECNKYYRNAFGNSPDINIEFVLPTEDPNGNSLSEAGVDRVKWDTPEMDCTQFMSSNNKSYINLLWDTDRYINIVLYSFSDSPLVDGTILGISQFPYTIKPDELEGLRQLNFLPAHSSLQYPHCISINNNFIYEKKNVEGSYYNSADIVVTIAHEIGHYLGLYHMFSESDNDNHCADTDYCTDTPTYDREAYMQYMVDYIIQKGGSSKIKWEDYMKLMERKDCVTLQTSTPNNVMDYDISWCNRFTQQQKDRMRYVLTHSPLIPGPKVKRSITRATTTPTELPMRLVQ